MRKPFKIGDMVSLKRSEHGWHDGNVVGRVTNRDVRPTGTYFYTVIDAGGIDYSVKHTRDMCAV